MKNKARWGWIIFVIVVILALWWVFAHRVPSAASPTATTIPVTVADPSTLPGILTTPAPWPANQTDLAARLAADSLPKLTMEGEVLHIHQHLDLFIDGTPVQVPALIGINEQEGWLSPIHVHDTTGIIHVESPYVANFTLGQFFDVWGVKFTNLCIGSYCTDDSHSLRVYVNGQLYQGDPRQITLASHQEIAIVYGTATDTPATVPSSYNFPAGY